MVSGFSMKVGGIGNVLGFFMYVYGFFVGVEGCFGVVIVGVVGGYMYIMFGEDMIGVLGVIDMLCVVFYGVQLMGVVNLLVIVGYGFDFFLQKWLFGSVGMVEGDYFVYEFMVVMQVSLFMEMGGIWFVLYVGLCYVYVCGSGFGENGVNGQNL